MSNFHDPRFSTGLTPKFEISQNVFTKEYVSKGAYHILKNGKKLITLFGSEGEANAYINKRNRELNAN
tara:strand:+ start:194 stop:397 length:204 start_codon:yes stop_codon:yes gene_type:complete